MHYLTPIKKVFGLAKAILSSDECSLGHRVAQRVRPCFMCSTQPPATHQAWYSPSGRAASSGSPSSIFT